MGDKGNGAWVLETQERVTDANRAGAEGAGAPHDSGAGVSGKRRLKCLGDKGPHRDRSTRRAGWGPRLFPKAEVAPQSSAEHNRERAVVTDSVHGEDGRTSGCDGSRDPLESTVSSGAALGH